MTRARKKAFHKQFIHIPDRITIQFLSKNFNAVLSAIERGRTFEIVYRNGQGVMIIPAEMYEKAKSITNEHSS